jgi:hypothetical protein
MDVEMLDLRYRKRSQEVKLIHSSSQKMLCLLIEEEARKFHINQLEITIIIAQHAA